MSVVESWGCDSGFPKNLTLLLPIAFGSSTWGLQEHEATEQSRLQASPAMPWPWKGPGAIRLLAPDRAGIPRGCLKCIMTV